MNTITTIGSKQAHSREAIIEAEKAIHEEVRKLKLEYAELSPIMRELLAACYIRGGINAIETIKKERKEDLDKPPTESV